MVVRRARVSCCCPCRRVKGRSSMLKRFLDCNLGQVDRSFRVALGMAAVSLTVVGPHTLWGLLDCIAAHRGWDFAALQPARNPQRLRRGPRWRRLLPPGEPPSAGPPEAQGWRSSSRVSNSPSGSRPQLAHVAVHAAMVRVMNMKSGGRRNRTACASICGPGENLLVHLAS